MKGVLIPGYITDQPFRTISGLRLRAHMTQHAPCTCNIFMLDWQSRDLMLSVNLESLASACGSQIY